MEPQRLAELKELLLRELRAACSAAIARGAGPDEVAADLAARVRRLRVVGARLARPDRHQVPHRANRRRRSGR
ncbi:hypothetical protein [Dactylosporangium sp. NPDC051541]|uniref:hypothetical protein n=1 Tax=Dactylosporangium sp. NPDC051541 TaxID=3363977 RepID=UPI0037A9CF46